MVKIAISHALRKRVLELLKSIEVLRKREWRDAWLEELTPDYPSDAINQIGRDNLPPLDFRAIIRHLDGVRLTDGSYVLPLLLVRLPDVVALEGVKLPEEPQTLAAEITAYYDGQASDAASALPPDVAMLSALTGLRGIYSDVAALSGLGAARRAAVGLTTVLNPERRAWLKSHKFHLDPFAYHDGAKDPQIRQYVYHVPGYYRMLDLLMQMSTVVAFAGSGYGKSSLANALAQELVEQGSLVIFYRDFESVRAASPITLDDHLRHVMGTMVRELWMALKARDIATKPAPNTRVPTVLAGLQPYAEAYLGREWEREDLLSRLGLTDVPRATLLSAPLDQLLDLTRRLCELTGAHSAYILVDPADLGDIGDPNADWACLRPLLERRQVLEHPAERLTIGLFLHEAFESCSQDIAWLDIHHGPPVFMLHDLWDAKSLGAMLAERLKQGSDHDPPYTSMTQLADGFDLQTMLLERCTSPRDLIATCDRLLDHHCRSGVVAAPKLTEAEAEEALAQRRAGGRGELADLLSQGEGQKLEFKSTLRYDLNRKQVHDSVGEEVALTIAAFMNARGGTLLIGVADDGTVLGLEPDLKTFKGSREKFRDAFTIIIRDYLGPTIGAQLDAHFDEVEDQSIFVVKVPRSSEPVFCGKGQDFYVRSGATSQKLTPKQTVDYLRTRTLPEPESGEQDSDL